MVKVERVTTSVVHNIELTLDDDKLACLQRILQHLSLGGNGTLEPIVLLLKSVVEGGHEGGDHSVLINKYGSEWSHWDAARFCRSLMESIDREMVRRRHERVGLQKAIDEGKERWQGLTA